MPLSARPAVLRWTAVLAAGAIGTVLYHLAQFRFSFEYFFADRGDNRFITYICEHWYQSLAGRASLLSPRFFHPTKNVLGYSDVLAGYALPYSALRALGLEMFSAMQAVVIAFNFLSFLACYFLLQRVLRLHALGSVAAALFFAFSSPKFAQLGHLQVQFTPVLPLLFAIPILFARAALDRAPRRAFVLLALFVLAFYLQLLTTFYFGWFFFFWSLLFATMSLLLPTTRRFLIELLRHSGPAIAGAACLALALAIPFFAIYLPAMRTTRPYAYMHVLPMIPTAHDFLDMGGANLLWGRLSRAWGQLSAPKAYAGELKIGIGLVPSITWIGLTLFALASLLQRSRSRVENDLPAGARGDQPVRGAFLTAMILATSGFIVVAMKYGEESSPWQLVDALVPGANAVRAVARYVIVLTLPMAVGFAWAIDRALRWSAGPRRPLSARGAYVGVALLAAVGLCEQSGYQRGFSKTVEMAYLERLGSDLPSGCDAFYLAPPRPGAGLPEHHYDAMMVSVLTGVPTLNGLSSRSPTGWNLWVTDPAIYDANVRDWIAREHIAGNICRLAVALPIEQVEISSWASKYEPRVFVRRQYLDLLRREPTPEELAAWAGVIQHCPRGDSTCDLVHVSETLFQSPEFRGRGELVSRLYLAEAERLPAFHEFRAEMARLDALGATSSSEEERRLRYAHAFAERIGAHARTTDAARDGAASAGVESAEALLQRARAELPRDVERRLRMTLYYFGYLQRDPGPGFQARLERFPGEGDTRSLTAGFLESAEYSARLGR